MGDFEDCIADTELRAKTTRQCCKPKTADVRYAALMIRAAQFETAEKNRFPLIIATKRGR
jgi:hypothetical protein